MSVNRVVLFFIVVVFGAVGRVWAGSGALGGESSGGSIAFCYKLSALRLLLVSLLVSFVVCPSASLFPWTSAHNPCSFLCLGSCFCDRLINRLTNLFLGDLKCPNQSKSNPSLI